jgi:hypothetical protein
MNIATELTALYLQRHYKRCGQLSRCPLIPLGPILASPPLPVHYASRVQSAADNVIPNAGEVLDATSPNQYNRVLLKVVPLSRDIGSHLQPIGKAYASHLPEG